MRLRRFVCSVWKAGLVCLGLVVGCADRSGGGRNESSVAAGKVEQIYLLAMPIAVNMDSHPGGDGFAVKIYAVSRANPKAIAISDGRLEIVMYDGIVVPTEAPEILRKWSYAPADLRGHQLKGAVGVGYSFRLPWEEAVPREKKITVMARYQPSEGEEVVSAGTLISVSD